MARKSRGKRESSLVFRDFFTLIIFSTFLLFFFVIFCHPFRLSFAPTISFWVSCGLLRYISDVDSAKTFFGNFAFEISNLVFLGGSKFSGGLFFGSDDFGSVF